MDICASNLSKAITLQLAMALLADIEIKSQLEIKQGKFNLLDILHHFTSGMKAMVTDEMYQGID